MITLSSFILLLVRMVVAIAFGFSAYHKFQDLPKAAKRNGIPLPIITAVAIAEAAGAFGIISGVLASYAAVGIMLLMLATMVLQIFKWKSQYWAEKGGWEYDLMLFTLSSVIAVFGAGAIVL